MGSAFHAGMESFNRDKDEAMATHIATKGYVTPPLWADPGEWEVERRQIEVLLAGHFWRYENDDFEFVAVERSFRIPIINPETGRKSELFHFAGKIDAIVRLPDARLAVLEYKTEGGDINPDSEYWRRLRCDAQISGYMLAARAMGFEVSTVVYDVTRKPTINPATLTQEKTKAFIESGEYFGDNFEVATTPGETDHNNPRIVIEGIAAEVDPGKRGFAIRETTDMYAARLLNDMAVRPDFYFARREIPRLESDLSEFQLELWQQAKQLRESQKNNRWFRNVSKITCVYCQFRDICLNSIAVDPSSPPSGFEILDDIHPELQHDGED